MVTSHAQRTNYRIAYLSLKVETANGPPYPRDMAVTELSRFGDNEWVENPDHLPSGYKGRGKYNFFGDVKTPLGNIQMSPENGNLIRQFKEAMVGVKFHRYALELRHPFKVIKPITWLEHHQNFRRIFAASSSLSLICVSQILDSELEEMLRILDLGESGRVNFIQHIDYLKLLADRKLISTKTEMQSPDLSHPPVEVDTTTAAGAKVLNDDQIAQTLAISLNYYGEFKTIAAVIIDLRDAKFSQSLARFWASQTFPSLLLGPSTSVEFTLIALVQVSVGNLISYHLGVRPSELLSMKRNLLHSNQTEPKLDLSRMTIDFQTFKAIDAIGGEKRTLGISSILAEIIKGFEELLDTIEWPSEFLFAEPSSDHELSVNNWNYRLARFCELHQLEFNFTGASWRKTLIGVMVKVFTNPATEVGALVNHKSRRTSFGYAQSSPFVMQDFEEEYTRVIRSRFQTIFEGATFFGGPGLGGKQGLMLEQNLQDFFPRDLTERDLRMSVDEFIEDMLKQGVTPIVVRPGVFCVKGKNTAGLCSVSSGDSLPDTSKCTGRCSYQIQLDTAKETLLWEIEYIDQRLSKPGASSLQISYWINQLVDQVAAWPDLKPILLEKFSQNERLRQWLKAFQEEEFRLG
ncbi:hypothetical protein [Rhizobium sp. ZW T2_16]|uniref:hypothetical protein n=1 Tax=Rhizobium sp. ZW T2_16 TaxID=3378083 RepID=UPI003854CF41